MKFKIINKSTGQVELLIYDEIGGGYFDDSLTARTFAEDLKALGDVSEITIRFNSPGGSVFDGLAIYNSLLSHKAKKVAVVEGLAGSIASVILQACDTRIIADGAFVMIHEPRAFGSGTADEMRALAGVLDRTRGSILDSYVKKAGESQRQSLSDAMKAETWYTATEALSAGLVDEVDSALRVAALAVPPKEWIDNGWLPVPDDVLNKPTSAPKNTARRRIALGQVRQRLSTLNNPKI